MRITSGAKTKEHPKSLPKKKQPKTPTSISNPPHKEKPNTKKQHHQIHTNQRIKIPFKIRKRS